MSDTEGEKPKFATGGYTGTDGGIPIYFNGGCYMPMNPALTPSERVAILANLQGCLVGCHRFAWLNAGGAECVDCGVSM